MRSFSFRQIWGCFPNQIWCILYRGWIATLDVRHGANLFHRVGRGMTIWYNRTTWLRCLSSLSQGDGDARSLALHTVGWL